MVATEVTIVVVDIVVMSKSTVPQNKETWLCDKGV